MGSVQTIKILLVDDNYTFLCTVRNFLAQLSEVEVVGVAYDGAMALEQAKRLHPDVVLLDIAMPVMNGLEAAAALNALVHAPQIVFLSMHDGSSYRDAARDLGAWGFVAKSELVTELIPQIDALVAYLRLQSATAEVSHAAH